MSVMRCPHCHQHISSQRAGVVMSPLKAALFDYLKSAGDVGTSAHELVDGFFQGSVSRNCASQHLKQLDDLLQETSYEIVCEGRSRAARRYLQRRAVTRIMRRGVVLPARARRPSP